MHEEGAASGQRPMLDQRPSEKPDQSPTRYKDDSNGLEGLLLLRIDLKSKQQERKEFARYVAGLSSRRLQV
ncbi:hypothetical protein C8R44DRAFT_768449 [Mycena epipterygia]|nr:hypothetical protein C8R44DRAFT_768449 [Mycena epipterygia]